MLDICTLDSIQSSTSFLRVTWNRSLNPTDGSSYLDVSPVRERCRINWTYTPISTEDLRFVRTYAAECPKREYAAPIKVDSGDPGFPSLHILDVAHPYPGVVHTGHNRSVTCSGIQTVFWRVLISIVGFPTIAAHGTTDVYVEPPHQHEDSFRVASLLDDQCDMSILAFHGDLAGGSIVVVQVSEGVHNDFVDFQGRVFIVRPLIENFPEVLQARVAAWQMWDIDARRIVDQVIGERETIAGGDFLYLVSDIGVPSIDRRFESRVLRVVEDLSLSAVGDVGFAPGKF